jgi:RNA recognition motif-containing protein
MNACFIFLLLYYKQNYDKCNVFSVQDNAIILESMSFYEKIANNIILETGICPNLYAFRRAS